MKFVEPTVQLSRSGLIVSDVRVIEALRSEFHQKRFVRLPKLLEPYLVDFVLRRLDQARWQDKTHKGIGTEIIVDDPPAISLLHFVTNTPEFLEFVQRITSCAELTWFGGRVYRFVPRSNHYDTWHNDCGNGLVGMSLNLSPHGYEGGFFQLRERESKQVLIEAANTIVGNATLFAISNTLEHRVTNVTGSEPKTAFAGWFQSGPPRLTQYLRERSTTSTKPSATADMRASLERPT